jgi:hypothetical protein
MTALVGVVRPKSSSRLRWPAASALRRTLVSEPRSGVKTLGIKVPDALHAQFTLVAQLDGISLGDAALRAVEQYVTTKRQAPDFAARAQAALEEIEKEAQARRGAIEGLFGSPTPQAADESAKPATRRRGGPTS